MRIRGIESLLRPHFSLRTFFVSVTFLSIAGYVWFIAPTQVARRFAAAVKAENYHAADELFLNPSDAFLADTADKRWAFRSSCDLQPLSLPQLLTGRRNVTLRVAYFEFDQNATQTAQIAAGPFGLKPPTISQTQYGARYIDAIRESRRLRNPPIDPRRRAIPDPRR
jgi:hypothetical protein